MGEFDNIEDKLREKLNSREFQIKDAWQADLDARLDGFNSAGKKTAWYVYLAGALVIMVLSGITYRSLSDSEVANYTPRENSNIQTSHTIENVTDSSADSGSQSNLNSKDQTNSLKDSVLSIDKNSNSAKSRYLDSVKDPSNLSESKKNLAEISEKDRASTNTTQNKGVKARKNTAPDSSSDQGDQTLAAQNGLKQLEKENQQTIGGKTAEVSNAEQKPKETTQPDAREKNSNSEMDNSAFNESITNAAKYEENINFNITNGLNSDETNSVNGVEDSKRDNMVNTSPQSTYPALSVMDYKNGMLTQNYEKGLVLGQSFDLLLHKPEKLWQMSVLGGLGISSLDKKSFLNNQKSSENNTQISALVSPQLDLRISRRISKSPLSLLTGVSTTTYGEQITYEDYIELNSSSSLEYFQNETLVIDTIYDMNDSILFSIDTTIISTLDSIEVITIDTTSFTFSDQANGMKKYTYVEVPIGMSYEFPLSEKTGLLAQPELSIGFLISQSGSYAGDSLRVNTADSKSLIFSGSLGLGVSHKLNDKFSLTLLARVRRPFGSLTSDDLHIRKYTHTSLQFGLTYRF